LNTKKILYFSIGPVGAATLGLITLPITTWLFSEEDIGRLAMMQVTISFSLLLFSLGLDQAYVREFYDVEDKESLLKDTFLPGFLLLLITVIILMLLPLSVSKILFGIDSVFLSALLFFSVFISFFSRFLSLILRMQEKGLAYSMSQLLPKIIFLLIVLFYVYIKINLNFKYLMIANVISLLAVFLIYAWNTKEFWISSLSKKTNRDNQCRMMRYALPLIGSGLAFWGLTTMDKLFLRGLSTFDELGYYSVAFSFSGIALIFQAIFSTVWAPIVYKWVKEGIDPKKIESVINYTALASFFIWSLTGSFSWLISYILPSEYNKVQYIMVAAIAYPLLYTLSEATSIGINIKKKTLFSLLSVVLALLTNAIGNWFLIPSHGAAGAAISSAIAFLVFFIIKTEISSRIWVDFPRKKIYISILILVTLSVCLNINSIQFYSRMLFIIYFLLILIVSYRVVTKMNYKQWLQNESK